MKTYITLFAITTFVSLFLTPIIRRISVRNGWLDDPLGDARRVHDVAVPRLGGVAIYFAVLTGLVSLFFINNLVTKTLLENKTQVLTVLVPSTLIFLFGIYDDLRGADARFKFLVQGLAGALFYVVGGRVSDLSVPFVGFITLPVWLGFIFTVLWVIAITNAFNLIDGIDGLAAGVGLFACLTVLVVSLITGNTFVTVIALALSGSLIGFLRYNFNPASIFLGDSGSLYIGFMLATSSVMGLQKASTAIAVAIPIMAFALPMIDTGVTVLRRFISNRPVFQGDREHIHHMLLARGWSQRRVVFVLYGVCALFGFLALLFMSDRSGSVTGLMLFVVAVAVVLAVGRLQYHEVDEIKAGMRRNFIGVRQRAGNNIRVRRVSRALSHATTIPQIFGAMREILCFGEFAYATVQLNSLAERDGFNSAEREIEGFIRRAEAEQSGFNCWSWQRNGLKGEAIEIEKRSWMIRLPLFTDRGHWGHIDLYREFSGAELPLEVSYLCDPFQREMARAVERVMRERKQKPKGDWLHTGT